MSKDQRRRIQGFHLIVSLNSGNLRFSSTWSISACALTWTPGFKTIARMNTTIATPVESAPAVSSNEALRRLEPQRYTIPAQTVEAVCVIISFHFSASGLEATKECSTVPCDCHNLYQLSLTVGFLTHNTCRCHLERGIFKLPPYFLPFSCQTLEASTRDPFRDILQPWEHIDKKLSRNRTSCRHSHCFPCKVDQGIVFSFGNNSVGQ